MSAERNNVICESYKAGSTLESLAKEFMLSNQRIRQILRKANVWRRQEPRPVFLGIDVTEDTKDKLRAKADAEGKSVSRLASEAIEQSLEEK